MAGAVNITFGAIVTGFVSNIGRATASVTSFSGALNGNLVAAYSSADRAQRVFDRGLGRLGDSMQSFGRNASLATAGIALLGATSFQSYAQLNSLQLGLENITGSTAGAVARFSELRDVARLPGLGLEEAAKGDVRLQAVGFSAKTTKDALLQFGNAIALTGGGKFELDSVLTQLTQMGSKAKVLAEDLKPILTASPAVAKAIKEMFGTVDSEQISAKLQASGRGPQDFIRDLIAKLSELERVKGGPKNALENFSDSVKIAQFEFGKAADSALGLTDKITGLGDFVGNAATSFGTLSPAVQGVSLSVAGLALAIGPLALGIGTLINLGPTFVSGFTAMRTAMFALATPIGAISIAIAAGVAAFTVLGLAIETYGGKLITTANRSAILAETTDKVSQSIAGETTKLTTLLSVARDETVSKKAREQAIRDLNALSPQYLGNLSLETINTAQATAAINQYTNALTLKAKVQTLSQQAADAQIAADRAAAKSAKDYVDKSRFSGDQIAINIKTTASFDAKADRERLFDELGKTRKDAEVARTKDVVRVLNEEVKRAYADAAKQNLVLEPPKIKPFDYSKVLLGSESDLQKAKDRLKALRAEIFADNKKGINTDAKVAEAKAIAQQIKSVADATRTGVVDKTALQNAQAELTKLESLIKNYSYRGIAIPDDVLRRYELLQKQVEGANDALKSLKPVDLGDKLKPIEAKGADNKTVGDILSGALAKMNGPVLPGLAGLQDRIKLEYAEFARNTGATIDYLNVELAERLSRRFDMSGFSLGELAEVLENAQIDLGNKVGAFTSYLGVAKDQLAGAGIGLLEGFGTALGKGENPLKSVFRTITGFIGDFAIKLGSAILLMGKLETVAAAIPALAPLFALTGPAKIAAGAGLVVGGAAIKAIPFAKGGIAYGPTLGLVGEYAGARNNPEVIAPLDKLKTMIGGNAVNVTVGGSFELDGYKLRVVLDEVDRNYQSLR